MSVKIAVLVALVALIGMGSAYDSNTVNGGEYGSNNILSPDYILEVGLEHQFVDVNVEIGITTNAVLVGYVTNVTKAAAPVGMDQDIAIILAEYATICEDYPLIGDLQIMATFHNGKGGMTGNMWFYCPKTWMEDYSTNEDLKKLVVIKRVQESGSIERFINPW